MQLRRTFVRLNGIWKEVRLKDIKEGNIFKMREPTGESVMWDDCDTFLACKDAYLLKNNKWAVLCDKYISSESKYLSETGD